MLHFYQGLFLRWYFKKEIAHLESKAKTQFYGFVPWQKRKKQMKTLLSNTTTFGNTANKTEGPTQRQFIHIGETHRS